VKFDWRIRHTHHATREPGKEKRYRERLMGIYTAWVDPWPSDWWITKINMK
jgi:hypothetical protein